MDWLLILPQIHSAFTSLGSLEGDTYVVNPNAHAILEEINLKLIYEDQTLRTFRRAIGFGQNVRTDLLPLLENVKDEAVLDAVIRILVNLTVPVECLFSVDVMYRTEVGRQTIYELNKLLYSSKEAFSDAKSTKSIVEYMKQILESESKLSFQKCDQINNCLLLLRNILHIPEANATYMVPVNSNGAEPISMQNSILWNLFIQSIDKLLLYLMTCPQRALWGATMVQLIALMYKDQHVSTLQKLLNLWFEASLSESSEDNESNTSPQKQGSGDSSPMLTSDPTSDSSDNGSNSKNNSSEDRRQALRDETDATLQEVSRKGHEYQEYQNSLMQTSNSENSSNSTNSTSRDDSEEAPTIPETSDPSSDMIVNDDGKEDVTVIDSIESMQTSSADDDKSEKNETKQPAKNSTHTTKPPEDPPSKNDDSNSNSNSSSNEFKTPIAILPKTRRNHKVTLATCGSVSSSSSELREHQTQSHQKVKHSAKLSLTKGISCPQKRECPSSQSELSDCGYGTQAENQESISTSSNDDDRPQEKPQHQKPPCNSKARSKHRIILSMVDKKELRRKKLVRRSKSSLINMKGLVQHTPTDDDISNVLKEFTVDFLIKGFGLLVEDLHKQLLQNLKIPIDTSHFFWLLTYFLKFAVQLELDMEHINTILTYDIISYLTYEGVTLCEQIELNSHLEGNDVKPYLRRMHLVVTAIREFLQAVESYKKVTHLSEDDRERLQQLQIQISTTEDLRCMFVLLLRRFNPNLHTKQYLQDLVVTNHILLLMLDSVKKFDDTIETKMMEHIAQFANVDVMYHYGMLLEDFCNNGEFVNDCIFTMMHHVGGDLGQISTLFQPVILKTYSRIWEADYQLCDDWSDLIEYVIHKFMNTPQKSALTIPKESLTQLTKEHNLENSICNWTQEEMDTLFWYYVQSKKHNDVVGKILDLFTNNGNRQKSRISIINQLLQQDIITLVEYDDLMKFEDAEYQRTLLTTPTSCTSESGIDVNNSMATEKPSDDLQILRNYIIKDNKGQQLVWLQKILLESCYIKLIFKKCPLREEHQNLDTIMEPVAYHSILKDKSIPVVQWNSDQCAAMLYQPFVLLLHKLGFQLPADAGSIFARIPNFWTPDTMFDLAQKLGPIDKLQLKFDVRELEQSTKSSYLVNAPRTSISSISSFGTEFTDSGNSGTLSPVAEIELKADKSNEIFAVPKAKSSHSIIRFTPDPSPTAPVPNWLRLVMRSKCKNSTDQQTTSTAVPQSSTSSIMLATNQQIESEVIDEPSTLTTTAATVRETTETLQHLTTVTSETIGLTATSTTTVEVKTTAKIKNHHHHHHHHQQLHQKQRPKTIQTATTLECPNIIGLNDEHVNIRMNNGSSAYANGLNENETSQQTTTTTATLSSSSSTSTAAASLLTTTSSTSTTLLPKILEEPQTMSVLTKLEFHQKQQQKQQEQTVKDDDDTTMKSFDRNDSVSSNFLTRNGYIASLENEFKAMVAAVYENDLANCDVASVASDLTRMYVSDEDERPELEEPTCI